MEKFAIVRRPDEVSASLCEQIETRLIDSGRIKDQENPDTVFVIGGDGTFIYAVHQYLNVLEHVRFYGIHTGTLGFYTDYRDCDLERFMKDYCDGSGREVQYPLLEVKKGKDIYYGINEMRIENSARTQRMDIYLNGQKFEEYRGTGMLVCTQLGSTAYNRSLNGAVVQEGIDVLQMSEIAGIHHSEYRSLGSSLIMNAETEVTFVSQNFDGALLGVDADVYSIGSEQRIAVKMCPKKKVRMYRGRNVSYFSRLNSLF